MWKTLEKFFWFLKSNTLVVSIAIGSFFFFILLAVSQTPTKPPPTPAKLATPTPPVPTLSTTDDGNLLEKALINYTGIAENDLEFSISQSTEKYAKGSVKNKNSAGGTSWLAVKTDGKWGIVYHGQATPSCSLLFPYNFPADIVPDCLDVNGNVVKR